MFEFNENGVCINPNIPVKVGDDRFYIEIRTAEVEGGWTWGIGVSFATCGVGFPVRQEPRKKFSTEEDAIEEAAKWCYNYCDRNSGQGFKALLYEKIMDRKQLTLF